MNLYISFFSNHMDGLAKISIFVEYTMHNNMSSASTVIIFRESINNSDQEQYFYVAIVMNFP